MLFCNKLLTIFFDGAILVLIPRKQAMIGVLSDQGFTKQQDQQI